MVDLHQSSSVLHQCRFFETQCSENDAKSAPKNQDAFQLGHELCNQILQCISSNKTV